MVTVLSDMACPKCGRIVPADSRFCSYCAADLRSTASPIELAHGPEAETAIITPQPGPRSEERREGRDRRPRRRHRKRPWLWIAVIAAVWMGTRLIHLVQQQMTPPPDDGSSASEPAYNPPGADAGVPPSESIPAPGLSRLRAALDADGYSSVHYRMEDGTLVLWGTVPNNFDQARVVMIVLINAGMVPMDDRIQVQDAFAGP
ncbi:MAG: zinc ribbon domain-containing protein [Candidatus Binataceae bacterium]